MAYNFRRNASATQKALSRRIHQLDAMKKQANLKGDVRLANDIAFEITRARDEMGKLAYGKA